MPQHGWTLAEWNGATKNKMYALTCSSGRGQTLGTGSRLVRLRGPREICLMGTHFLIWKAENLLEMSSNCKALCVFNVTELYAYKCLEGYVLYYITFISLRQGFMKPRLASNSRYSQQCPWTSALPLPPPKCQHHIHFNTYTHKHTPHTYNTHTTCHTSSPHTHNTYIYTTHTTYHFSSLHTDTKHTYNTHV